MAPDLSYVLLRERESNARIINGTKKKEKTDQLLRAPSSVGHGTIRREPTREENASPREKKEGTY